MDNKSSFFDKAYNPFWHAALMFAVGLVIMLGGKLSQKMGLFGADDLFSWMTASAFLLLFAISNSIFSIAAPDLNKYWIQSMLSFAVLAAASAGAAFVFSSLWIDEAGSYQWIFFVVTFGYLVFLSLVGFAKRIIEFAQKEEWNQPRRR